MAALHPAMHNAGVRHLPNLLTILRLVLVPVIAGAILRRDDGVALALFLSSALSDLADGYLARRFGVTSRLGALLDPVADKASMFSATVLLAWQGHLPWWLAVAIVLRDVVIVGGALAYRRLRGTLRIAPTRVSKINTALEFGVLLAVLAVGAGWLPGGAWLQAAFGIVLATVVASGAQYVWLGARGAFGGRRTSPPR